VMFTISKSVLVQSSLTPVQRGHVGGSVDLAIGDYLDYQCGQNGKRWCIVSLEQIQRNIYLTRGIKRCTDTISDHLHRLESLGILEIRKRTRRLKDGSLFLGRNLYKLTPRFFDGLERVARKAVRKVASLAPWKERYGFLLWPEKTPDSTYRPGHKYPVGATFEAPHHQKGGPSAPSSHSPPRPWPQIYQEVLDRIEKKGS